MALRSEYKGFKKLAKGLKLIRPGTLAIDDTALAEVFFPRSEQAVLGAKNLANLEYREMTNDSTFTESNGVYTIANNNGTSQYPSMKIYKTSAFGAFPAGKYTLSVNIVSFTNNTAVLAFRNASDNAVLSSKPLSVGKMSITYESAVPFTIGFLLRVSSTADAEIQFSEFMLALDNDLTYAPFAMTNEQLTERIKFMTDLSTKTVNAEAYDLITINIPNGYIPVSISPVIDSSNATGHSANAVLHGYYAENDNVVIIVVKNLSSDTQYIWGIRTLLILQKV